MTDIKKPPQSELLEQEQLLWMPALNQKDKWQRIFLSYYWSPWMERISSKSVRFRKTLKRKKKSCASRLTIEYPLMTSTKPYPSLSRSGNAKRKILANPSWKYVGTDDGILQDSPGSYIESRPKESNHSGCLRQIAILLLPGAGFMIFCPGTLTAGSAAGTTWPLKTKC